MSCLIWVLGTKLEFSGITWGHFKPLTFKYNSVHSVTIMSWCSACALDLRRSEFNVFLDHLLPRWESSWTSTSFGFISPKGGKRLYMLQWWVYGGPCKSFHKEPEIFNSLESGILNRVLWAVNTEGLHRAFIESDPGFTWKWLMRFPGACGRRRVSMSGTGTCRWVLSLIMARSGLHLTCITLLAVAEWIRSLEVWRD